MKDYIEERAVEVGNYIIETKATVRQTAKKFGISKSTVHKDVTTRLASLNPALASLVVTSLCTVDFDIPNLFAVCLTVALVSII